MSAAPDPGERAFYARSVHAVARDLVGCILHHGQTAARIVEVESYHQEEPACHAFIGPRPRTEVLFGPPGRAYVYRSYGVHALLNAVAEDDGVGAAVLIRAAEPLEGVDLMRRRRGTDRFEELCNGPGKLTQALGIDLGMNGADLLSGPIAIAPRDGAAYEPEVVIGERIGITKGVDLPWRFCDARSRCVSRPWPEAMKRREPVSPYPVVAPAGAR